MSPRTKTCVKFYWIPVLFFASQALCMWIFFDNLLHFYDHHWWVQAINALGLPLSAYNVYRMGRLMGEVHRDVRKNEADLARWQQLGVRSHTIRNAEEFEAFVKDIEALDPAMAADIRRDMQEWLKK
jgi:hypothetical protein